MHTKQATPRFLLIDAGNTRVKWALASPSKKLRQSGQIPTRDVTRRWTEAFARKHSPHPLVLASVVPKVTEQFRRAFGRRLHEVSGASAATSLPFLYPKPSELGADRLAVAIAAQAERRYPAIIIACGTAIAFTVLDAKGRLCGGAIAPGLQAQLDALLGATAQLPATMLRMPRSALAKSTRDAIRAGVMLSYRGGVKEIVRELLKSLPARPRPHMLLTGGDARLLARELGGGVQVRPLLVLEGLHIMASRILKPAP